LHLWFPELKVRDPETETILIPSDYEEFYRVSKAIISYQGRGAWKYYPLEPKDYLVIDFRPQSVPTADNILKGSRAKYHNYWIVLCDDKGWENMLVTKRIKIISANQKMKYFLI